MQPSLSEAADMWLRSVRRVDARKIENVGISRTEWQDIINRAALIDMMRRRGYR